MSSPHDGIFLFEYSGPGGDGAGGLTIIQGICEGAAAGPFRVAGKATTLPDGRLSLELVFTSHADGELVTGRIVERTDRTDPVPIVLDGEHLAGKPFTVADAVGQMTVQLKRLASF